jgi:hypothetical protein
MATPVLFRADRHGPHKGEVTAVFPTIPGSPGVMTCYAHIGQHSSCSLAWHRTTRAATPAEYTSLKRELESIGYSDLKVYQHVRPWMDSERLKAEVA